MIDFTAKEELGRWASVDDVVMGGISRSHLAHTERGTLVFSGHVSLENGGGFASVRTALADVDLGGAHALALSFRGDGKTYKLRLRTTEDFDGVSYQVAFPTQAGVWTERSFAFEEFEPVWRGRPVLNAPRLEPERVCGVGFMISDRQAGPFRLEVASLSKR